jgi:ABC-2 type transport system permease protein
MSSPAGVIHDIGYRHYSGLRLGRGYAVRSLYAHSLRTAYGLGRTAGAKVIPWIVFAILLAEAAVIVAIQSQLNSRIGVTQRLVPYWVFPTTPNVNLFVLIFCAAAAPALVSRDLRAGVLQLYFSRPLARSDYPLAKYTALVSAVFLALLAPLLLLFLGNAFSQNSMSAAWHEAVLFSQGVVTAAILAALFSAIALLIASLSARPMVGAALIAGFFILTTPVLGILQIIAHVQVHGGELTGSALTLSQLSFLVSPLSIVNGIASWLFGGENDQFVGPFGPLYLAVTLGIIVLCLLLTLLRYRKVAR